MVAYTCERCSPVAPLPTAAVPWAGPLGWAQWGKHAYHDLRLISWNLVLLSAGLSVDVMSLASEPRSCTLTLAANKGSSPYPPLPPRVHPAATSMARAGFATAMCGADSHSEPLQVPRCSSAERRPRQTLWRVATTPPATPSNRSVRSSFDDSACSLRSGPSGVWSLADDADSLLVASASGASTILGSVPASEASTCNGFAAARQSAAAADVIMSSSGMVDSAPCVDACMEAAPATTTAASMKRVVGKAVAVAGMGEAARHGCLRGMVCVV